MPNRFLWSVCDRLASLPTFPALVMSLAAATALVVGIFDGAM